MLLMLMNTHPLANRNWCDWGRFKSTTDDTTLFWCVFFFFAEIIFWHCWSQEEYMGSFTMESDEAWCVGLWASSWAQLAYLMLCACSWTRKMVLWMSLAGLFLPLVSGQSCRQTCKPISVRDWTVITPKCAGCSLCWEPVPCCGGERAQRAANPAHCALLGWGRALCPAEPSSLLPWRKMRGRKKAGRIGEYVWPVQCVWNFFSLFFFKQSCLWPDFVHFSYPGWKMWCCIVWLCFSKRTSGGKGQEKKVLVKARRRNISSQKYDF